MSGPSRFALYKRSTSGIYHISYFLNGRRHFKSTAATTKPEALRALSQFQELLEATPHPTLVGEFFASFLEHARTAYSAKTLEIYRRVLPKFVKLKGNVLVVELTPEHFDRYKANRIEATRTLKDGTELRLKPASVNLELRTIRAAFNTARRWQIVKHNPFSEATLVSVPEQAAPFLSVPDFQRLLDQIKESWFRDLVLAAAVTGMRRGEILNLKWSNVDFDRRVVNIETSPSFRTKNGRRRTIPLSATALNLLRSRQGRSPSEYVFTLNDERIAGNWAGHLFKRYVRDLKLDGRLHFHSLRHTFASWLVQRVATLYEVQRLLGHSSSDVTEVYSHLQPDQMHETVNRISVSMN